MPEKAEANGRFTPSGIPIKDFYGPEDVNGSNRAVEVPGTFPFTRGRRAGSCCRSVILVTNFRDVHLRRRQLQVHVLQCV